MSRRGVSRWMFLLVPAHPGRPGQRAVKRSCVFVCLYIILGSKGGRSVNLNHKQISGLSRTFSFNFKDFPGPGNFKEKIPGLSRTLGTLIPDTSSSSIAQSPTLYTWNSLSQLKKPTNYEQTSLKDVSKTVMPSVLHLMFFQHNMPATAMIL